MAKKHPTRELIQDLSKLFKKHGWSGQPIGLSSKPLKMSDVAGDGEPCPDGKTLQWVTYKAPNGEWVTKQMCV